MISINLESHVKNPVLKWAVFALFFTVFAPKLRFFSSLISKRLCSISHSPTGLFSCFEHKNSKKFMRISFHFINPRSEGTKFPGLPPFAGPRCLGVGGFREHKSPIRGDKNPWPAPVLWGFKGTKFPYHLIPYCRFPVLPFRRFPALPFHNNPAYN
jgi:hypothetical protein